MAKRKKGVLPKKKLTLLLYMAGDNDLSNAGLRDIEELCREGAAPDLHVGVEIDTFGEHTGSTRYEITEPEADGRAYRKVIERLSERDSGKPATLLDFLQWGVTRYPARKYVIVIGGHGDGFRSRDRAIAVDDFGSALDMPEIEYVLERANFHRQKIGILGFDACLMGMLEIAHHFAPFADYLVGSQQVEPGEGWPYDKVLSHLKRERDLERAGIQIADCYIRHYVTRGVTDVTQSVIRLRDTATAMKAFSKLGEALLAYISSRNIKERAAIIRSVDRVRAMTQSFRGAEYVDALHFVELLSGTIAEKEISRACRAFTKSIARSIVKNRVPARSRKLRNANGLSIWFPGTMFSFIVNRSKYLQMRGVSEYQGWVKFLDSFFSSMRHV